MNRTDESMIRGVSRIKADYSSFWPNAFSRTSTLILVDYDDNVEYYEFNLTNWTSRSDQSTVKKIQWEQWRMNQFKFRLKPNYKQFSSAFTNRSSSTLISLILILSFLFSKYIF
jgi:hypothetical protein